MNTIVMDCTFQKGFTFMTTRLVNILSKINERTIMYCEE